MKAKAKRSRRPAKETPEPLWRLCANNSRVLRSMRVWRRSRSHVCRCVTQAVLGVLYCQRRDGARLTHSISLVAGFAARSRAALPSTNSSFANPASTTAIAPYPSTTARTAMRKQIAAYDME